MKNISKWTTYSEAVTSQTATRLGIDNTPNAEQLVAMQLVGLRIFDVVRQHFGKPLRVSSFFRNTATNTAVKGSRTSQHTKGQAIDIQALKGVTNKQIFDYIKDNLDFDQLIWEFGTAENPAWVHVSYVSKDKNRKQVLTIK